MSPAIGLSPPLVLQLPVKVIARSAESIGRMAPSGASKGGTEGVKCRAGAELG